MLPRLHLPFTPQPRTVPGLVDLPRALPGSWCSAALGTGCAALRRAALRCGALCLAALFCAVVGRAPLAAAAPAARFGRQEPDLNSPCITASSWLEYFTLQSQAVQNAFADANADVASGLLACPVAASTCPLSPLIYCSAFASANWSGINSAATGTSPYVGTYGSDYYAFLGQMTVANERSQFPPTYANSGRTWGSSASQQNLNVRRAPRQPLRGSRSALIGRGRTRPGVCVAAAVPAVPAAAGARSEGPGQPRAAWAGASRCVGRRRGDANLGNGGAAQQGLSGSLLPPYCGCRPSRSTATARRDTRSGSWATPRSPPSRPRAGCRCRRRSPRCRTASLSTQRTR